MKTFLSKILTYEVSKDLGLLIFRILAVFSLLKTHGLPKLFHIKETMSHIPDPMGLGAEFSTYYAIFSHVFCGILIALGLFTRLGAFFIVSITLSGLLLVHLHDPNNVQDVPLIYSIVFGYIILMGPGKYSLDYKLFKK